MLRQAPTLGIVTSTRRQAVVTHAASAGNAATQGRAKAPLVLNIYQPKREVNWDRWELRQLHLLEQREAERAASGAATEEDPEDVSVPLDPTLDASAAWASYFRQYDNPAVHHARLRDLQYMGTWAAAVRQLGPSHIKDKVVLDVGCGLGLLSLLCAREGARKVVAVDGSQAMVDAVKQVASANGYGGVIEAVCGRVEDIRLKEKADVIVSDWTGPALLLGGMLPAVAYARRNLLKPGGLVLPSSASLHATGIAAQTTLARAKRSWEEVLSFDLTPVMSRVIVTPQIAPVDRTSQLCTSTAQVHSIDLTTLTASAARQGLVNGPFMLECQRDERLSGIAVHFDLAWAAGAGASGQEASTGKAEGLQGETTVETFTTDARAPPTVFQQVLLSFPRSIPVRKGDVIQGSLSVVQSGMLGADVDLTLRIEFAGVAAECKYTLPHSMPSEAHAALLPLED